MSVSTQEIMKCVKCEVEIPSKRLEILPNTKTCVKCSTTGVYSARIVQLGDGDHTCTEIDIMTPEQAKVMDRFLDKSNSAEQ